MIISARFNRSQFIIQRFVTVIVLFTLAFSDAGSILQLSFLPKVKKVEAAAGDIAIFRENKGTETVDSNTFDVSWDTTVQSNSNITLQGNNSDIDLADGGKYLALYNVWANEGTSTAGDGNRRAVKTWLSLDGIATAYGRGGGYIRDGDGDLDAYAASGAILDVSVGADLQVHIERDDTNPTSGVNVKPATNGISLVKLKDSWDYIRLRNTATSSDISGNTSFTDVTWNTSDEVDTNSFGFTPTSPNITLKGADGELFLVTVNVGLRQTANSNTRQNYEMILTLGGSELNGTRVSTYPRGNTNGNGIYTGTLVYTGLIAKTSASDQTLNIEVRRENTGGGATTVISNTRTALTAMKVPNTAEVIMVGDDTGTQQMSSSRQSFTWNQNYRVDSSAFSHSTSITPNQIEIDKSGDYLFFSTIYATTSANNRSPHRIDWSRSGSVVNYGGHGGFNRGSTAFSAGSSGGLIMSGMSPSDYIELSHIDETSNTSATAVFNANKVVLQGIALNENFFGTDTSVSALGSHVSDVSLPNTDVYLGGTFVVEENSGSRFLNSITLTETGTIDAQNGLDNIEIWYDLSTTTPYDCNEHSFNGNEIQYGATDTNGFSGANGVSSFSGSTQVTTSQSFCGYVVYDVTASASDSETIDINITNPSTDVSVSDSGTVGPITEVGPSGFTTLRNSELTQIHYNWRNDDGSETGATSVEGSEDTAAGGFSINTIRRLRVEVSVEGSSTSTDVQYRLQYGEKAESCSAVSTWIDVAEDGGDWDVADSPNVAFGNDTTNVALQNLGGVTDEETVFFGTAGLIDGGDKSLSTVLAGNEFYELEYSLVPTSAASEGTTYCFRVVDETPDVTHPFRIPLTIQSSEVDSTLTDFPVYVNLRNLGDHFFSNVNSDGGDIRVTTDDGTTEVAREIVSINTGSKTGEMYFNAPSISASADTTFYIYYGASGENEYQASSTYGAEGVWNSNYEGVYHLSESGSTYFDSTRNGNNGIGEGTDPTLTTGKIGSGQAVSAGHIDLGNAMNASLITAGEYLVSVWLNLDTSASDQSPVSQYVGAGDFLLWADTGGAGTGFCHYNGTYMPTDCQDLNNQNVGSWQHVVARYDGTSGYVYLDGINTGAGATASTFGVDASVNFSIGSQNGDSTLRQFNGQLDEVRIVSSDFGEDWIESEYTNQNAPTTFYSTSTQEALSNVPATIIYDIYPEASINADITVTAIGSNAATLDVGEVNGYVGGAFAIVRTGTDRTVTGITITETGSIDAQNNIDNIELWYDLDILSDCSTDGYDGDETQFGSTDANGFSATNGTSTFTGSRIINTTNTMCVYVVLDIGTSTINGETLDIEIFDPSTEVVVTGSTVGPSSAVSPTGNTTIAGPILTQTHYHWRNDDGDETNTGATSATGGTEDTTLLDVPKETTKRLRLQVSNEGSVSSVSTVYRLEYGTKISTCELVSTWNQVGVGNAFHMSTSTFIADGNTTDVDNFANGAMTEENITFFGTGALRETTSDTAGITLSSTQFTELEYSIEATIDSGYDTTYCFRVTSLGTPLNSYTNYAQLTTREKQDFYVQRGSATVSGTSLTINAGANYVPPASTSSAFVRITNSHMMGAGNNTGANGQQADDVTAYISDQSDITNNFTIGRPSSATSNTRVDWEIVEYIGLAGADNEMIVRDVGEVSLATTELTDSGNSVSSVSDDSDVVVFITGQQNNAGNTTNYNDGVFTASWNATTSVPEFERGDADSGADVSYAVVEFTGENWIVERAEHNYTSVGVTETEDISADVLTSQMFVHAQKRIGENILSIASLGHQVWVSSMGTISFELRSNATSPSLHTSVAWVVKNTQPGDGALVSYRSAGAIGTGAPEPSSNIIGIGGAVNTSNASIFPTNYANGTGNTFPRVQAAYNIASSTDYELWQSDTNNSVEYRVEVIEWPVADTALRQNYYRLYVDNDAIDPTDPWPIGGSDLGENTSITAIDDPVAEGEAVRIRLTAVISNATLPELTKSLKLQYGRRISTCSTISTDSTWVDVGAIGSGAIWRGYDGTPLDGTELATSTPAAGRLNISVSDVAGTYEEENNSAVNPYSVDVGEDVEYDWVVQHNGALQRSDYCFRMVETDDSLLAGYNNYPTVRTTGYTPVSATWQWFGDETSITPVTTLAVENSAPTDISNNDIIKLRVGVHEVESASGSNVRFALQYSQTPDFSAGTVFLVSTSTCKATSTWCYADGAGFDATKIDEVVLSDSDSCLAGSGNGCGHHNEGTTTPSTLTQPANSKMEFEFSVRQASARVNGVYYFRLYDLANDDVVIASSTYPSLVTEGAQLVFGLSGLNAGATIDGETLDATSTPTSIPFGSVPFDTEYKAGYRLQVNTNATQGYKVLMFGDQQLVDSYGNMINPITGTNVAPDSWSSACLSSAASCFGYHVEDDILENGSTRFGANDTYAALSTGAEEVMYSSAPIEDTHDILYKLQVREEQAAGDYETNLTFISIPIF